MRGLVAGDGSTAAYTITLSEPHPTLISGLEALPGISKVSQAVPTEPKYQVQFDPTQLQPSAVLQAVLNSGAPVVGFAEELKHLNQAFMDLTEAGVRS